MLLFHNNAELVCFNIILNRGLIVYRDKFLQLRGSSCERNNQLNALNHLIISDIHFVDVVSLFTLQLMQLNTFSDPSVFEATNDAEEIKLNYSNRFTYMQYISDHD